ncbi:deoxyribodipyrimidine photo-lyase [Rhizodiscina lignyota]|uniref:Deoxyribodipyrimidine photo-lyase n=1 Tax=Rhizodiscina lignyota TaxID=1504668 RepID=A0A9P4IEW4_9PEZI|nr:deoxyribodipyrimidine photo-lyase [Rhizodiscina lignyota]
MAKREEPSHPELKHPDTKRAKKIDVDTPYDNLLQKLEDQKSIDKVSNVAHWFRSKDLRIQDNIALHHASTLAQEKKKPLLCFYLNCPPEFEWHGTSPARTDFILEALRLMQGGLKKLNIPLVVLTAEKRSGKIPAVTKFLKENDVSHVFANYEYEVDELRRDEDLLDASNGEFQVSLHHDQTIVEPGSMMTEGGKPMKVFTPYHRAWLSVVKDDPPLLDTVPEPKAIDASASEEFKSLFDSKVPSPPESKTFASKEEQNRIRKLWPPGHDAGIKRLDDFIGKKIEKYASTRSNPAKDNTSRMSAYFSSGMVSVREALSKIKSHNDNSADFSSNGSSPGVASWVREIVFRELYRQTTLTTPHTAMNLPQNLKFDFVKWEEDTEGWKRWYEGKTGYPFVDAGMRQLNHEAYMHNRLRMNVSSFLYCNLLIDYRRGERYFAEHLIDWDLSNNTQGWEPSYTVFNPVSQGEKNDPDGGYIRKWVPELKDVEGKAIFDPYHRMDKKAFEKLGYPAPYVDWARTKQRCIERFKNDMSGIEP